MIKDLDYIRSYMHRIVELNDTGFLKTRESSKVEFKETFNWSNAEKYSKTIAAFANNQGGYLVFGVKDKPRKLIGLDNDNFDNFSAEKLAEYMKSYYSDSVDFEIETLDSNGLNVGWIYVRPQLQKPLICTKSGSQIKDGAIYFRNGARNDLISSASLLRIIDERRDRETERWMGLFKSASKAGIENVALLDMQEGVLEGSGGSVIIDESILQQVSFIKEGEFNEKIGAPTLRVVGSVEGSKTTVIEKKIDPELKFTLISKEVGVELGFENSNSASSNAMSLIKYFGLNSPDFMHEFKIGVNTHKKFSQEVVDILKQKADAGEFEIDKDSESMKKIRKAAQKL